MEESLKEFSFWEHIEELRSRLLKISAAIILLGSVSFFYSSLIMDFLTKPFRLYFGKNSLIGLSPSEAFTLRLWLSFYCGLIFGSPYILWQTWKFFEPALYRREKLVLRKIFGFSVLLFLSGVLFSFYVMLPFALNFFISQYELLDLSPQIRVSEYLSIVFKMVLGCGIVFLFPCVSYILSALDVISPEWIIEKFRFAVVGIFILAAILTPPDVFTQLLLAGPMIGLYILGYFSARWAKKEKK